MENLALGPETRSVATRMEHVHLGVANLDRSVDWYRRAFDFRIRYDETGPYGHTVHAGTDSFYIAMTEHTGLQPSAPSPTAQIYHFGFTIEDMPSFVRRLEQAAIPILERADRKEGPAVYLRDPDGHEIEVVAYRKGYAYK